LRGLIYGLFSYLLFKGIFEKKIKSLISSVLVLFAYHALLLEALPGGSKYYWEHEFIGFLSGIVIAKFKTILVKSFD
jgi:membrane associated rhomboid family serine protease